MTIVGFYFTKIEAVKKDGVKGKINIANNVSITDVKEAENNFGGETQKGVNFSFKFTSKYEPEAGAITLEGNVLYMENKDVIKKMLASWKKEKKIEKDLMKGILNTILTKSNIQALILSRDINLPPPIPLPKVETKQ